MVGLDVTEKTQCTPHDFNQLAMSSPEIGGFLRDATEFYFDFTNKRQAYGHVLCDPLAILAITDPNLFKFETMPMHVVCDGEEIGRTKCHENGDRRKIKVAMDVKSEMARQKFLALVANADSISASRKVSS